MLTTLVAGSEVWSDEFIYSLGVDVLQPSVEAETSRLQLLSLDLTLDQLPVCCCSAGQIDIPEKNGWVGGGEVENCEDGYEGGEELHNDILQCKNRF